MQVKNASDCKSLLSFTRTSSNRSLKKSVSFIVMSPIYDRINPRLAVTSLRINRTRAEAGYGDQGEIIPEEDDDLCPVECVKEFDSDEEFTRILDKAGEAGSLVIVDFYRTSCGSCKYIEQGFAKLCRGSGDEEAPVIYLKHNVLDEYDEQSEVAERLRIKTVPLFHFYKNGVLLEAFATRDKERIMEAIRKYTSSESQVS